jgi:hypothetical protein
VTDELPTKQQLAWAGRVWDQGLRRDCEAFYWLTFDTDVAAKVFGMHTWEQIGYQNQLEITRNLLRVEGYFMRAKR